MSKKKKGIPERKRLAAIFASFTILIMGSASLLESMSLDYYTVLGTLTKVIPASIIIGALGWVMGMILDKPKRKSSSGIDYNSLYLNSLPKNDIVNTNLTEDVKPIV